MANNRLAKPYFLTSAGQRIPLGFMAHGILGKRHVGGTWNYVTHVIGGRTYRSHYLTGEIWDTTAAIVYRQRSGNGLYGSKKGKTYKDQYAYGVPWPNGNPAAEASRIKFAQAVLNWQTVLTDEEKIAYNARATRANHQLGYNIYIGEFMRA